MKINITLVVFALCVCFTIIIHTEKDMWYCSRSIIEDWSLIQQLDTLNLQFDLLHHECVNN